MTPNECIDLCTYIHRAVPAQQWADGTPDVWWDLGLKDVSAEDARTAVQEMIRGRVFIDYTSIVEGVRKLRAKRLAGIDEHLYLIDEQFPSTPEGVRDALAARRAAIARIADGETHDAVFGAPAPVEARRMPDLGRAFRRVSDVPALPDETREPSGP